MKVRALISQLFCNDKTGIVRIQSTWYLMISIEPSAAAEDLAIR